MLTDLQTMCLTVDVSVVGPSRHNPHERPAMSKYPFARLAVGETATYPNDVPKSTLRVVVSKLRDAARREFDLADHELPAFRIEEDREAGVYLIERLPDGTKQATGPKPAPLSAAAREIAQAYARIHELEQEHAQASQDAAEAGQDAPALPAELVALLRKYQPEMLPEELEQ